MNFEWTISGLFILLLGLILLFPIWWLGLILTISGAFVMWIGYTKPEED